MSNNIQRLNARIFGRVQGVSFRFYTHVRANELDLTGWVRNRADGSVEVVAEGDREHLESLLAFLHRGSPAASVTQVEAAWLTATEEFSDFTVH